MLTRWFLLFAAVPGPAYAVDQTLCQALNGLKHAAATSGPQRVTIFKQEEMTFACGRRIDAPAQVAFCDAAAAPVGVEFTHVFPWLVFDCLHAQKLKPGLTLLDQYTGIQHRKKLVHLWAQWTDGARIDVRFRATADFGTEPEFKDYWGTYELVVWWPGLSQ